MSEIQWSKITIGGTMALCEGLAAGHAMEQAKIGCKWIRQATGLSYFGAVKHAFKQNGIYSVLYRGFFPFGALQAVTKGLPILFVEGEVKRMMGSHPYGSLIAGVTGGVAQGVFVAPTQRIKTLAMTHEGGSGSSVSIVVNAVRAQGLSTLVRGTVPMAIRRGVDWGVRFAVLRRVRAYLEHISGAKQNWHAVAGALCGGMASGVTLPLDNVIANMQKSGSSGGVVAVTQHIYRERGILGFFNGFAGRVIHSGYHTMWVGGFGLLVYEWWKEYSTSR